MEHIGHNDIVADCLNIKGHVVRRQLIVVKALLAHPHPVECVVKHIHAALVEVRGIEIAVAVGIGRRQPGKHRLIFGLHHSDRVGRRRLHSAGQTYRRVPGRDGAVDGGKKECGRRTGREQKVGGTPLKMIPVGLPVCPDVAAGILTTNDSMVPLPAYRVLSPVRLSETHHGLPEPRASPQALTRLGVGDGSYARGIGDEVGLFIVLPECADADHAQDS